MHLGRGRGVAYPECITHIGIKRIGINKSCVVSHRGALRSAETLRVGRGHLESDGGAGAAGAKSNRAACNAQRLCDMPVKT